VCFLTNIYLSLHLVAAMLKHPRTPTTVNPGMDYPSGGSDYISKRTILVGMCEEVFVIYCLEICIAITRFLLLVVDTVRYT
jgi:hypothetical protein